MEQLKEGEKTSLNLVLKGDVSGSVEALEDALFKLDIPEEIQLRVLHRGVGAITESDVIWRAPRPSAVTIIGFNVRARTRSARWPTARAWRSGTTRSSTRPSRRSRPRSRACSSRSTRRSSWAPRRSATSSARPRSATSPVASSGPGIIRRNAKARLLRDGAVVADNLTISSLAVQGRRDRGPRGLRVWSDSGWLQQRPGRRHHRDLRDAGEAARLIRRLTQLIKGFTPTGVNPLIMSGPVGGIVRGDVSPEPQSSTCCCRATPGR